MPIDPEFPKNYKVIGKHKTSDGSYVHLFRDQEGLTQISLQTPRLHRITKQEANNMLH